MQTYELEEADGMTLFIALNEMREVRSIATIRLRVPRGHLRQMRHNDQRPANLYLPDVDYEFRH